MKIRVLLMSCLLGTTALHADKTRAESPAAESGPVRGLIIARAFKKDVKIAQALVSEPKLHADKSHPLLVVYVVDQFATENSLIASLDLARRQDIRVVGLDARLPASKAVSAKIEELKSNGVLIFTK